MKKFILKIIYSIFNIQDMSYDETSSTKTHIAQGAVLSLSAKMEQNREKVKNLAFKIARENKNNLEKILLYPKGKGVELYKINGARKILALLKENTGFIFPKKGFGALIINIMTTGKFSFRSPAVFVFDNEKLGIYKILYCFYIYLSYEASLPGLKDDERENFKNVFDYEKSENLAKLNYKDILSLRNSIARDTDAMKFALEFAKELKSKDAYKKINNEGGANI